MKRPYFRIAALALIFFASGACSSLGGGSQWGRSSPDHYGLSRPSWGGNQYPEEPLKDGKETGIASWYGPTFYGKPTASGETFRKDGLTGAHRTLPLGTRVRVRNLRNNETVDVTINDRGPFVEGRIIDLSWRAAKDIGMLGTGTAPVELTVLTGPEAAVPQIERGIFEVQVGSFSSGEEARQYLARVSRYPDAHIVKAAYGRGTLYRVRIGSFDSIDKARDYARELKTSLGEAFVVRK